MALTDQDRDSIKLLALEIGTEINKGTMEAVRQMIDHHQLTCPAGQQIVAGRRFLLGIVVGLGLLSTGGSALGSLVWSWIKGS